MTQNPWPNKKEKGRNSAASPQGTNIPPLVNNCRQKDRNRNPRDSLSFLSLLSSPTRIYRVYFCFNKPSSCVSVARPCRVECLSLNSSWRGDYESSASPLGQAGLRAHGLPVPLATKRPSTDKWINKMWYIHIMKYSLSTRKEWKTDTCYKHEWNLKTY